MSTFDVQVLIMQLLNDIAELPPVYDADEVPPDAERPYGTYGPPTSTARGLFGKQLPSNEIVLIDWWGNDRELDEATGRTIIHGNGQVAGFAKISKNALNGFDGAAGEGRVTLLRWEQDVYVPDEDQNIRHVQQRFRVHYESV